MEQSLSAISNVATYSSVKNWTLEGIPVGDLDTPRESTVQICPRFGLEHVELSSTPASRLLVPLSFMNVRRQAAPPRCVENEYVCCSVNRVHCQPADMVVARDGTTIPITLVTSSSTALSGDTPMIMTSYGGFGASVTPRFSILVTIRIMLELGAAFALPHIRGGGGVW